MGTTIVSFDPRSTTFNTLSILIPMLKMTCDHIKENLVPLFTAPPFHRRVDNEGQLDQIEKIYQKAQAITRAYGWSAPAPEPPLTKKISKIRELT